MPTYEYVLNRKGYTNESQNAVISNIVTVNADTVNKAQDIIDTEYPEDKWEQCDSYELAEDGSMVELE